MDTARIVVWALAGAAVGFALGFGLGRLARGSGRLFAALNALVVIAGMAANFLGLLRGMPWLAYGALGIMGGGLTGVRYGFTGGVTMVDDRDARAEAQPGEPPTETGDDLREP
ncbi:MAG: hypothetical protein HGB10_11880 [Coriobacteriia bacterium]|nr:hypothetical protein [Coriobacteriia bacterium]